MKTLCRASLIPEGFAVEGVDTSGAAIVIAIRGMSIASPCPACASPSLRVHSRYRRRLTDLPFGGRVMQLTIIACRFYCDAVLCGRRISTERFKALAPWAPRTVRLDTIVRHLGLALGGRPAANSAGRLMIPVTNDTLLRVVRRHGKPPMTPPNVIGIDDWAWRRNFRYGTLVCDIERRRTIALLPDREPATAQAWLAEQQQIEIIARDRGGSYALAAAKAVPHAVQVADRWHLMENASQAFLDAVRRSMPQICYCPLILGQCDLTS